MIFKDKIIEPVKRLKTVENTVVNSVTWIGEKKIVCGCDNGKI